MKKSFYLVIVFVSIRLFSQNITDNLLLHYTFDGNTNDTSGNNNNGVPFGVTYGPDRFGNANSACYFNGIDSFVNFPNLSTLKPNLPVSFSFWINYASDLYNNQVVFNTSFEEDRCTGVWFNSSLTNNGHAINFGDGTYNYSPSTRHTFLCYKAIELNQWRHIIVVVNSASDMKIYIDCFSEPGIYSGSGGNLVYSSTPGCIGRHDRNMAAPPDYFKGYIDDFMYWDRALSSEDVAALCADLSVNQSNFEVNKFNVYPNPTNDRLNLETNLAGLKTMTFYNYCGQEIYSGDFKSSFDVSNFSSGIYFLKIKNDESTLTQKVIVK